jgi:transmembrane 9 superfamily protein 3
MTIKILLVVLLSVLVLILGDDINHRYSANEAVAVWVNSVGPYHNPQETYPYYQLPFCKPEHGIETHKRPSGIIVLSIIISLLKLL